MQIGLLIALLAIVLVGGTLICIGWWKLADKWFPGASRKTGQEIRLGSKRRREPDAAATVIKDFPRATTEPGSAGGEASERDAARQMAE